jgi:hypothetical protein
VLGDFEEDAQTAWRRRTRRRRDRRRSPSFCWPDMSPGRRLRQERWSDRSHPPGRRSPGHCLGTGSAYAQISQRLGFPASTEATAKAASCRCARKVSSEFAEGSVLPPAGEPFEHTTGKPVRLPKNDAVCRRGAPGSRTQIQRTPRRGRRTAVRFRFVTHGVPAAGTLCGRAS